MKAARIILINIVIFVVLIAAGVAGYYYLYQGWNYISTDDAKVTGVMVTVAPTTSGKLSDWKASIGQTFSQGDEIGMVDSATGAITIPSPITGTVVQNNTTTGEVVGAGQPLATIVDMKNLYIIANIDESKIKDVKVGETVDIVVSVEPGTTITGKVEQIGLATNSMFSLIPQDNASGDYTKVTQLIPVEIQMSSYPSDFIPGMNATVKIHKNS